MEQTQLNRIKTNKLHKWENDNTHWIKLINNALQNLEDLCELAANEAGEKVTGEWDTGVDFETRPFWDLTNRIEAIKENWHWPNM